MHSDEMLDKADKTRIPNEQDGSKSAHPPLELRPIDSFTGSTIQPGMLAVPLETMELIRQVARYHGKIHEGMHRTNGDLDTHACVSHQL